MWEYELLGGGLHSERFSCVVFNVNILLPSSFTLHLCFSDRGFEEESQRGAGERGGEGQKAQWGNRCTDAAAPAEVSICVVYLSNTYH